MKNLHDNFSGTGIPVFISIISSTTYLSFPEVKNLHPHPGLLTTNDYHLQPLSMGHGEGQLATYPFSMPNGEGLKRKLFGLYYLG